MADSEEIAAYVSAHMLGAAHALRAQDMEGVIEHLTHGVVLYEQHPSCVHQPTSQLRDLLVFIRAARSVSKTVKQNDGDLRELEERTEALRQSPLH